MKPRTFAMQADDDIRCSDAERDAIAADLRRHAVAGRLSLEELDERLGRALQARTRRELDATLDGLPGRAVGSSPTGRLAALPATRAAMAIVALLAVALWATGHLGEDAMMIAVAAATLLLVIRPVRTAAR
jgi:Domain of unknown function (DUF1707)